MQALTFGAGVPLLYPIAALAMLLNTIDTRYKLAYMWPVPRRFGATCTYTYLRLFKIMIYVHVGIGAWMHSYFHIFGQIAGACLPPAVMRGSMPPPPCGLQVILMS